MKMARDGRLRTLHRRDWPGFLNRVVPSSIWQALSGQTGGLPDARTRWSAKYVVLCWVAIGWSIQPQLTERFREGWGLLAGLYSRRRRAGGSYQGLVKATQRLGTETFQTFWHLLRGTIPERLGRRWKWYGWTVLAVDGSRIDAPRTRRNERGLKLAGRDKTHPQWWVTWIIHLPTNVLWDWRQGPGRSSERSHLREMVPALPDDALVVADIGFGGFDLLWHLTQSGVCFLIRCASNTTLLSEFGRHYIERRGEIATVHLWPTNRRSQPALKLRLIVLKRKGKRVYLLTNVTAPQRLSRSIASELYAARWDIEVEYRNLKQTMGRCKVLAQTPEAGAMELAGNILALALLMLQGAMMMGAKVVHLSVAMALKLIRRMIEAVRCGLPTAPWLRRLRTATKDQYVRRSSRRARDWPHKKNEPFPKPPKLRRPTKTEKKQINAYRNDKTMVFS